MFKQLTSYFWINFRVKVKIAVMRPKMNVINVRMFLCLKRMNDRKISLTNKYVFLAYGKYL